MIDRDNGSYTVAANDRRGRCPVTIRHGNGRRGVLFQSWLWINFALANPPQGLFGRLLLRNFDLHYAA
jgi:hypothetical protein